MYKPKNRRPGRPIHGTRWVTHDAAMAFIRGKPFKRVGHGLPGTEVRIEKDTFPYEGARLIEMFLHGHRIAVWSKTDNSFMTTLAGHNTPTTRERLNGLIHAMAEAGYMQSPRGWYSQKNYGAYFNDEEISKSTWQVHNLHCKA